MLDVHEREHASVLALLEVDADGDLVATGAPRSTLVDDALAPRARRSSRSRKPEDAPSNLAVIGRYVFTPGDLRRARPHHARRGRRAAAHRRDRACCSTSEPVFGRVFTDGRYDIGQKLDFLRANIELALDRADLGPELADYLARARARRGGSS